MKCPAFQSGQPPRRLSGPPWKGCVMKNYEKMYEKLSNYMTEIHEQNQRRIKIGLRLLLLVPTVFLIALLLTGSNKVFFLILWILSMFLLSFYLIAVEYGDFKLQEKQKELGVDADVEGPLMDLNKLSDLKTISELKLRNDGKTNQGAKK